VHGLDSVHASGSILVGTWDVIEVKQNPLLPLVRFEDGVAVRPQLRREELTGALAPLHDEQFFSQVMSRSPVSATGATRWMSPGRHIGTNRANPTRTPQQC
jgi:hypothetical protein